MPPRVAGTNHPTTHGMHGFFRRAEDFGESFRVVSHPPYKLAKTGKPNPNRPHLVRFHSKEFAMRTAVSVFGMMLLTIAVGPALGGEDKEKPAEAPKEQSVVEYDSKTHGAVQVKSASPNPVHWFDVLKNGKSALDGKVRLLDGQEELPPGTYVVRVNRTERKVTIEAGKMTILLTGDLMVESKREGVFWFPKQGKENRFANNMPIVNARMALFPGTYDVYMKAEDGAPNDTKLLGKAEVKAGKKTVIKE
jgi:hypothetical protein